VSKDEEIESESDSGKPHKETFLVGMEDDEEMAQQVETVEEKRLKMTKQIIKEYASEEKTDFFATLSAKTLQDQDILNVDDDQLTKRMKLQVLE
jgi:type III secretory pathway component EscR